MVWAVGGDRVTSAGDLSLGGYSFAGADPVGVFERVYGLDPEIVEFNLSYRSALAVLRTVNALTLSDRLAEGLQHLYVVGSP